MTCGKVKFFDEKRAFGFVSADDGSGDYYLGAQPLDEAGIDAIKSGDTCEFEVAEGKRGPRVVKIRLLTPQPAITS